MPRPDSARVSAWALALLCLAGSAALAPKAALAQDDGAPKWGKWLRQFNRDRLLKPPFHNAPEDTPKGLASKIRARELDVKNRVKAVEYLEELDCTVFPEAKLVLVDTMLNDDWEPVRYEAAKGLRNMLSRHSCGACAEREDQTDLEKMLVGDRDKEARRINRDRKHRLHGAKRCGCPTCQQVCQAGYQPYAGPAPCHCSGCCDEDTLNALSKVAYEMTAEGCPVEPSYRVRAMAAEAIAACGVPCNNFGPYYADEERGPMLEEVAPPVVLPEPAPGPVEDPVDPREIPAPDREPGRELPAPLEDGGEKENKFDLRTTSAPEVRTNGLCLVSLKNGRKVAQDRTQKSVHRGRTYYFASAACKRAFDENPQHYAVGFGGCDPVEFVQTRQVVEGRFLVLHEGRFFMFARPENYDLFRTDVARYTGGRKSVEEVRPVLVELDPNGRDEPAETPVRPKSATILPTGGWVPASN